MNIMRISRRDYQHDCRDNMPSGGENGDLARCECGRWYYRDVDLFGIWWPVKRRHKKAIRQMGGTVR